VLPIPVSGSIRGRSALWWRRCARRASAPCREVSSWRRAALHRWPRCIGAGALAPSVRSRGWLLGGVTGAIYAIRKSSGRRCLRAVARRSIHAMQIVLQGYRVGFVTVPGVGNPAAESVRGVPPQDATLTGVIQLCAWLPRCSTRFATRFGPNSCSTSCCVSSPRTAPSSLARGASSPRGRS